MKTQSSLSRLAAVTVLTLLAPSIISSATVASEDVGLGLISKPKMMTTSLTNQPQQKVKLTIIVKDSDLKPVVNARVNIWRERLGPEPMFHDYQGDTDVNGVAVIEVQTTRNFRTGRPELDLHIRVVKTDFVVKTDQITLKQNVPTEIERTFILTKDDSGKTVASSEMMTIKVRVMSGGQPVEGVRVDLWANTFPFRKNYFSQTDRDGNADVLVKRYDDFEIIVESKDGPKVRKPLKLASPLPQIAGPVTIELGTPSVTVIVKDQDTKLPVTDAEVILQAENIQARTTTDNSGTVKYFDVPGGKIFIWISQKQYQNFPGAEESLDAKKGKVFVYELKPIRKAGSNIIYVTVLAADKLDPLPVTRTLLPITGARVTVSQKAGSTDSHGRITFDGDFEEDDAEVVVEAEGYKRQTQKVSIANKGQYKNGSGSVSFVMQPEATTNYVDVTVKAVGPDIRDGRGVLVPVQGATVSVPGTTVITDGNGQARLPGHFEGIEVNVTKDGYLRQTKIASYSGGVAALQFQLRPLDPADSLEITVHGENFGGGNALPIAGASVTAGPASAVTDRNGQVNLNGKFGDRVEVAVEAKGFARRVQSVSITKPDGVGKATVILIPLPVRLIVEVRDQNNNERIAGAKIQLRLIDKQITLGREQNTNSLGEANFELRPSADAPLGTLRSGVRVDVRHDKYNHKFSDIAANLLDISDEARRFTIYLERDWTAATNAVTSLEARVTAWRNDASMALAKTQSLDRLGAAAPAARGRAESWLNELKDAKNFLDAVLPGNFCQGAIKHRDAITAFQNDARQKEYEIKRELDQALALAKSCASSSEADLISAKHRKAIRLAGEIGVLEKKALEANQKLSQYAKAVKEGEALSRKVQSNVAKIHDELMSAKMTAERAENDFNRAQTLSPNLTARRDALITEIVTVRAAHELDKFTAGVPLALARRLDNSEVLLKSNTVGFPHKPNADELQIVKDTVSVIQNYEDQAATLASGFKNAICDLQVMDDVIQDMGTITMNATIELGAAANLPNEVAECVKRGACSPIVNEIRNLLQQGNIELAESKFNQARAQGCDLAAVPGGIGLPDEIEYYKTIRDAAAVLKVLLSQCKFQEAQAYVQKMPPSTLNKPLLADAVRDVQNGLEAQKRVEQFLNKVFQATNAGRSAEADQAFASAQNTAAPYACLVKRVNELKPPPPKRDSTALGSPVRKKPEVEPLPSDIQNKVDAAAKIAKGAVKEDPKKPKPVVEDLPADVDSKTGRNPTRTKSAGKDVADAGGNQTRPVTPKVTARQGIVPNVVTMKFEDAVRTLRSSGLEIRGVTDLGRAPSPEKANTVQSQSPVGGQKIPADKKITLMKYGEVQAQKPGTPAANARTGSSSQNLDLSGTWRVTTKSTGTDSEGDPEPFQQNWTRTNTWQITSLGGGRWRVRQTINGRPYEEIYGTVDEGSGRFRLIGAYPDGRTYQMTGTYSRTQFSVTTRGGNQSITISGTRQ